MKEQQRKKLSKLYLTMIMMILFFMNPSIVKAADISPLDFKDATKVTFNQQYSGTLYQSGSNYKYSFEIPKSGKITISFKSVNDVIQFTLYNQNGKFISSFYNFGGKSTTYYLKAGTYYLETYSNFYTTNYTTIPFTLNVDYVSSNESFVESLTSNDDSFANANTITFSEKYYGQFGLNDDQDVFKFTVPIAGKITVSYISDKQYAEYAIYDKNEKKVYDNRLNPGTSSISKTYTLAKGTYYFIANYGMMTGFNTDIDDWGFYNFKLTYNLTAQGKISSATRNKTKATIKYKSVSGASGYQVAYSTSKSFSKSTTKYVNTKKLTTKLKSFKKNKNYYVRVRPYVVINGKTFYGKYSSIKSLKK